MLSTLIVGRMQPQWSAEVARLFSAFDQTDMPDQMGTRRRELFSYQGLYFHLQDFDDEHGGEVIEATRNHSAFIQISDDLKQFITPYDPATWRSPKDAMATRFYHWAAR